MTVPTFWGSGVLLLHEDYVRVQKVYYPNIEDNTILAASISRHNKIVFLARAIYPSRISSLGSMVPTKAEHNSGLNLEEP